jgi:hypothetical protein
MLHQHPGCSAGRCFVRGGLLECRAVAVRSGAAAGRLTPASCGLCVQDVRVAIEGGPHGPSWTHQPLLQLPVVSTAGFVPYTLVKVPAAQRAIFFRIDTIDADKKLIRWAAGARAEVQRWAMAAGGRCVCAVQPTGGTAGQGP